MPTSRIDVGAGTAPHSLKRLALEAGGREIAWPLSADGDPFANVNTPEDLAELERRAARQNPGQPVIFTRGGNSGLAKEIKPAKRALPLQKGSVFRDSSVGRAFDC